MDKLKGGLARDATGKAGSLRWRVPALRMASRPQMHAHRSGATGFVHSRQPAQAGTKRLLDINKTYNCFEMMHRACMLTERPMVVCVRLSDSAPSFILVTRMDRLADTTKHV